MMNVAARPSHRLKRALKHRGWRMELSGRSEACYAKKTGHAEIRLAAHAVGTRAYCTEIAAWISAPPRLHDPRDFDASGAWTPQALRDVVVIWWVEDGPHTVRRHRRFSSVQSAVDFAEQRARRRQ